MTPTRNTDSETLADLPVSIPSESTNWSRLWRTGSISDQQGELVLGVGHASVPVW